MPRMNDAAHALSDAQLIEAAREGVAQPAPLAAPAWDQLSGRVRVGLWRAGELLGRAETATGASADQTTNEAAGNDIAAAVRSAAAAAVGEGLPDDTGGIYIDVEVVTEVEPITPDGLSGLLFALDSGIHGLVLRDGDKAAGGWPADALRGGRGNARWTKALLREVRPPGARLPADVGVARFRARQVVAPLAVPTGRPAPIVPMQGATRVVDASAVTRQELARAASLAGAWLARHQQANGLFHYAFLERTRAWSDQDSLVRQAGCAWALAVLARVAPNSGFAPPAARAMQGIARIALKRDGPGNLAYLQFSDGPPRLGAIPLFLLATDEWGPRSPVDTRARDRLTATLLALQTPAGGFGTQVRGFELEGSETYYGGQIALALGRRFAVTKRDRIASAGLRAVRYYREWWQDGNEDLSFLTWMIQACDAWHAVRNDETARDFAFQMADWALTSQHPADHPNPLWAGAFERTPGVGTAAYTEGMLRALALARRVGDEDRVARYSDSVRDAMRFLLQLSMEDADLAFVGGPEHRGAIRSSLRRRNLRCDNAQHFIMSALGGATELFREEPSS